MNSKDKNRVNNYYKLNSILSSFSSKKLAGLLNKNKIGEGWGSTYEFNISELKVFAKKIPLTDLEFQNAFSTKNLYRLPKYYNYGVGSAGFGAFRELLTHVKTTNWVLNGEISNFPLMYHYRIVPRTSKLKPSDPKKHDRYVKKWNSNKSIDHYVKERGKAKYEVILLLEHFPYNLNEWLIRHTDKIDKISKEMNSTITFLRKNGIIHFDAHFSNILTDGQQPYLTDFGLALDRDFELTRTELDFFDKHTYYDYGEFIGCMGGFLGRLFDAVPKSHREPMESELGLCGETNWLEKQEILLSNLDALGQWKPLALDRRLIKFLRKNKATVLLSDKFFYELIKNPKKNTKFDNTKLRAFLKSSSVI